MLTSDRKFGIEIEFICQDQRGFRNICNQITVVSDGSLRPHQFAGEWVSRPLQGSAGVKTLEKACEVLKKNRATAEESCTSVHVHLDGKAGSKTIKEFNKIPDDRGSYTYAFSGAAIRTLGKDTVDSVVQMGFRDITTSVYENVVDGIRYFSKAPIDRHPRMNYTYYVVKKEERWPWLQRMLYFYTLYSPVMEGIVSDSRKFGNMYCIPLGVSYDLDKILSVSSEKELRYLWYKGNGSSGHYDNSRYHNVNLHSFWDRHGTVEIRSHGGTIDANKILLWVRLHQKIADKLETMDIKDIVLEQGADLYKSFIDFVEEPVLQDYIKRLLGYYSNIKIK